MPRKRADASQNILDLVHAIWGSQGKDYTRCELCQAKLSRKSGEVHHTKYVGATLKDLVWVCHSCNMRQENIGLQ